MIAISEKNQAELYHREGNLSGAKKYYALHLKNHPDDADAYHALGILSAQSQEYADALENIKKAIALNATIAAYYNSLGNVYRHLKQFDKATQTYQKAIKIQPNYAIAYNNIGTVFYGQEKLSAARIAYEKAIALKENYADAHSNLGILLTKLEEDALAMIHLERALALNPTLLPALNQLGDLYLRHEKYDLAENIFLQCVEKMPENAELNHRLGVAYFGQQKFEDAKNQFEKVLMIDHKHLEVNQYLANTYLQLCDHEKALLYYFRQLERKPFFETHYNLGVLLMMKDKLRDALLYFQQAEKMEPADLATQLNCGNVFLKGNQIDQALIYYKKANETKPNDPEIQHILSALTQEKTPDNAPEKYVSHLFDEYAPYYEQHLADVLQYAVPKKMFDVMQLEYPTLLNMRWNILDLGCGTGFCGTLFKHCANKLTGVDLSENMLSVAKQKGIYDELIAQDITQALKGFSSIDLIIAADVFTYVGNLELTFNYAANALVSDGLFIFTVEKMEGEHFTLQTSIRYAHSKHYLESLITSLPFDIIRFENIQLRKQKNLPAEGYLVLLKKHSI